jgi:hypothetical protein
MLSAAGLAQACESSWHRMLTRRLILAILSQSAVYYHLVCCRSVTSVASSHGVPSFASRLLPPFIETLLIFVPPTLPTVIEGLMTIVFGMSVKVGLSRTFPSPLLTTPFSTSSVMLWIFPSDISTTKMLTEPEREIALERLAAEGPSGSRVKESTSSRLIFKAFFNVNTMACTYMYICDNITVQG